MYDWIRRMYRDMEYVVKVGKSCSDTFTSSVGVLAGDSLSPTLWNIYFSDFTVPDHPDDVVWEGVHISHVEHADDVALMSFSPEGLQHALDHLNGWCRRNFMAISVPKTHLWTSMALIPESIPRLHVAGQPLSYVTEYNFVGIRFDSACPYMYDKHYKVKATQARLTKDAIFSRVENRVGSLPVKEGLMLYTAKVDPHLIAGCEIALDIDLSVSEELRQVSLTFLRHLLSVHPKTGVAFLHAETGIMPLYFRRLILALRYLRYLSALPHDHLGSLALRESVSLRRRTLPSWFGDLQRVLARLAPSINVDYHDLSVPRLSSLIDNVEAACLHSLNDDIQDMVKGSMLRLSMKHIPGVVGLHSRKRTLSRRSYLSILIPAHRKALTRLLVSSHVLAVEVLRWTERYRPYIPRHWRLCRFCRVAVEDEPHVLLVCATAPGLACLRRKFVADVCGMCPQLHLAWDRLGIEDRLACLLQLPAAEPLFAQFVHHVFEIFRSVPVYIPPIGLCVASSEQGV
ncbi:hypothetical protein ARMGADRAFT_920169 [Armillaria gallica]|uniref:Reverse transcriptase domain-containing protein n=1 Tax=Armillaria gallica TaxID=47427 RepID=A0A2H3DWL6_ARMGA|nr:hypothetical protein ARMGADRAFT_920169 [Armillaria gallica]